VTATDQCLHVLTHPQASRCPWYLAVDTEFDNLMASCAGVMPTATEQDKEYLLFLESLGIPDVSKVVFLAGLLRDAHEAAAKLDKYSEPHGAFFHSAISRLLTTDNPHDAPAVCWVRVLDRLGFFTDTDPHAQRIVNVGLSFAYLHKHVDSLAAANALALDCAVGPTAAAKGGPADVSGSIPSGGRVIRLDAPHDGGLDRAVASALGGGTLDTVGEVVDVGELAVAGQHPLGGVVACRSQDVSAPASDAAAGKDLNGTPPAGDDRIGPGGFVVARRPAPPAPAAAAGDPDPEEDASMEPSGPSTTNCAVAPTLAPSQTALDSVCFVLTAVVERADVLDVLRDLLSDALACLVRSRETAGVLGAALPVPQVSSSQVSHLTASWWPTWELSRSEGKGLPPAGTVAYENPSSRKVWSSRWCIHVDMVGIKEYLQRLHTKDKRYFVKGEIPVLEVVSRLIGKKPLRLTVVVACMLLMATKEVRFGGLLTELVSAGRAPQLQGSRLSTASVHEFATSSMTEVVSAVGPAISAGSGLCGAVAEVTVADTEADAFLGTPTIDLEVAIAEMEAEEAAEDVVVAAKERAKRIAVRRRVRVTSAAAGAVAGAAAAGPTPPVGMGAQGARRPHPGV